MQVVDIDVPLCLGEQALRVFPKRVYLACKGELERLVDEFDFGYWALFPLKLLQVLYRYEVWTVVRRAYWLCLVLLECVNSILIARQILSFIDHSSLIVVIQLEDLADLKVGQVDLRVLDDDGQLLQLVEFAQSLQIVKHDINRSFKYQRRHEILQLLSVDPRRDHVLQLIDLSEHLRDDEAERLDLDDAASALFLQLVEIEAKAAFLERDVTCLVVISAATLCLLAVLGTAILLLVESQKGDLLLHRKLIAHVFHYLSLLGYAHRADEILASRTLLFFQCGGSVYSWYVPHRIFHAVVGLAQ